MSGPVKLSELFNADGPGRGELDELVKSLASLSRQLRGLAKNFDADAPRIQQGLATILSSTQTVRERLFGG